MSLLDIPWSFPVLSLTILWDHSFSSNAANKQTSKQTNKRTVSNVLLTPTDIVGLGNKGGAYFWRLWSWCSRTPQSRDGRLYSGDGTDDQWRCTARTRPHILACRHL